MRKKNFIIFLIFINFLFALNSLSKIKGLENNDFKKILSSQNMKEEKEQFLDINTASEIEMLSRKISSSYVEKILEYREIVGGFEKLEELKRIKGIGGSTYLKLSKKLKIKSSPHLNFLDINDAGEKILRYFGFSKKEIKKINIYRKKNGKISNNIELKKIITKSSYERLKNNINYN